MQQLVPASRRLSPASSRRLHEQNSASSSDTSANTTPFASVHGTRRFPSFDAAVASASAASGLDREAFLASKGMMGALRGESLSPPPGMMMDAMMERFPTRPSSERDVADAGGMSSMHAVRVHRRSTSCRVRRKSSGLSSPLVYQTQNDEQIAVDTFGSLPTAVQALTSPTPNFLMCRTSGVCGGCCDHAAGGVGVLQVYCGCGCTAGVLRVRMYCGCAYL